MRSWQAISTNHSLQRGHPEYSNLPRRLALESRRIACKGKSKRGWLPSPSRPVGRISVQYCASDAYISIKNDIAVFRANFRQAQPSVKRAVMQPSFGVSFVAITPHPHMDSQGCKNLSSTSITQFPCPMSRPTRASKILRLVRYNARFTLLTCPSHSTLLCPTKTLL